MKKKFWRGKKVLITGGGGFLGSHLVERLKESKSELIVPRSKEYNLTEEEKVSELFEKTKPDIVIHLAANQGGIEYMKEHAGEVFYDNIMMNTLLLEYSKKYDVKKFVGIGSVYEYTKETSLPFREENLWEGNLEEITAPYGFSKKMMLFQSQIYKQQFGLNTIHLLLTTLYGPKCVPSHVVPSLINRINNAMLENKKDIEVWGTGNVTRDFLYAEDAVEGILRAIEFYNSSEPVNISSGKETTIKTLVETIADLMHFKGKIIWDASKSGGLKRACLDNSKAKRDFGFEFKTSLEKGLKQTIDYFQSLDDLNL